LALFDFRARHRYSLHNCFDGQIFTFLFKSRGLFRKYKGCVGSVRGIYSMKDKPYFAVVGLDRFLRIFKYVWKIYTGLRIQTIPSPVLLASVSKSQSRRCTSNPDSMGFYSLKTLIHQISKMRYAASTITQKSCHKPVLIFIFFCAAKGPEIKACS